MIYDYRKTKEGLRVKKHKIVYKITCCIQKLLWRVGVACHNKFADECTPDFNCCENIGRKAFIKFPKRTYTQQLERAVYVLYEIIDDIDTASDMAKFDNEQYRKMVEKIINERDRYYVSSDGYYILFKNKIIK